MNDSLVSFIMLAVISSLGVTDGNLRPNEDMQVHESDVVSVVMW